MGVARNIQSIKNNAAPKSNSKKPSIKTLHESNHSHNSAHVGPNHGNVDPHGKSIKSLHESNHSHHSPHHAHHQPSTGSHHSPPTALGFAQLPGLSSADLGDESKDEHGGSPQNAHLHGFDKLTKQLTFKAELAFFDHEAEGADIQGDLLHNAEAFLRDDAMATNSSERLLMDDIVEGGIVTKGSRSVNEVEKLPWIAAHDFTHQHWFTALISTSIMLNAIQMGIQTDHPDHKEVYFVLEQIWTTIFFAEMVSKFIFQQCRYFRDSWNILDFFLVSLSVVEEWILPFVITNSDNGLRQLSILRMLRIMRTLRFIRLLKVFKELWLIVKGMISSVKTIFWATLLLIMVLYVSSIFCVQVIGHNDMFYNSHRDSPEGSNIDFYPDWDAYQFYGTVPRSMFTLFEVCLEPLSLRPVLEKQLWIGPLFMCFMFLTTFGVMNVIIGVIVDNTAQAAREAHNDWEEIEKQEKVKKVECIRDACILLDTDGDGFVTEDELKAGLSRHEISECLVDLQLPYGCDESELFQLLDSGSKGKITHGRLMTNLARNIMQSDMQHALELKGNMHHARRNLNNNHSKVKSLHEKVEELEQDYDKHLQRLDQVELLSLEMSRHLSDIVALGAGLPQKPPDCVDQMIKKSRAGRDAALKASRHAHKEGHHAHKESHHAHKEGHHAHEKSHHAHEKSHHAHEKSHHAHDKEGDHGHHGHHKEGHAESHHASKPKVPPVAIPQKPHEYEQGKDHTPRDQHFDEGGSSSNEHRPSKPKVPLSPRHGSKEPTALPAIPLASNPMEPDEDHQSEGRQSQRSSVSRQSKMSIYTAVSSKMSVPPALNILLTAADFDGQSEGALGRDETDSLFSFLPVPDHGNASSHDDKRPQHKSAPAGTKQKPHDDDWEKTERILTNIPVNPH